MSTSVNRDDRIRIVRRGRVGLPAGVAVTRSCVAGVDGGGTRTRALLLAEDGTPLARAEGPAALVRPTRPEAAAGMVAGLVRRAAATHGVRLPLPALWAGLAGAGCTRVRRELEALLREEQVARSVRVGTDAEAAFHDAFGGGPGIMVVAGTGSVVLGVGEDGRRLQVGGWGAVIGDEGSGYHLGIAALRAVARAADGRATQTDLTGAVLDLLDLGQPRELATWAQSATKADIAALAPLVVRMARTGDPAAAAAFRLALDELRDQLSAAIRELFPANTSPPVALTGGLIAPGGPLRSDAERVVARANGRILQRAIIAERGAAHLALALPG